MKQYHRLLKYVLAHGDLRDNRTNTQTLSCFGYQMRFNLQNGFPLLTTKEIYWKSVVHELLWFIRGDTNIQYLKDNGVHIWDEGTVDEKIAQSLRDDGCEVQVGDVNEMYGHHGRIWLTPNCSTIDQLSNVIKSLTERPYSRRHIINTWNPVQLPNESKTIAENLLELNPPLAPCHGLVIQFYVSKGQLSCHIYQRSADVFLGVPFNIASYALLTEMIAHVCGYDVGSLIISFGDIHIYTNHLDQVEKQLNREPLDLPTLYLSHGVDDINSFTYDDILLSDYNPYSKIQADVSV